MRTALWLLFVLLTGIMTYQSYITQGLSKHKITELEFANAKTGKEILCGWAKICYAGRPLLKVADDNTRLDFLFILTYVSLMIGCSYSQMQRERWLVLNSLLRLNLFLAVLAGLFDVAENIILLYDLRHVSDPIPYVTTTYVTWPKWVLSGWIVLVWIVSGVKNL